MRIQLKLFLLLLIIAIVPLAVLSWRGERATENLGHAMAEYGKTAITQGLETQLRQAVGYSSDLLAAQQRQVELALHLQAVEVERRLARPPETTDGTSRLYLHSDFDDPKTWPPGTELALDHAIASPEREKQTVPISRLHQSFFLPAGVDAAAVRPSMERLASMDVVYHDLSDANPGLLYWQYVTLNNGVHSSYPGHGGYPTNYDPRQRVWYQSTIAAGTLVWTAPLLDASTRRLLLTAAVPVMGPDREVVGVTGIDIDILAILNAVHGRVHLGATAESYIVQLSDAEGRAVTTDKPDGVQMRVVGSSTYRDTGAAWDTDMTMPALAPDNARDLAGLVTDLIAGRSGIRQMSFHGRDSLWVYGQLERLGTALLYIVPVDDIESIADRAQESVRQTIFDQIRLAGIASVILIAVVAGLAMVAARSVTMPLLDLAKAAQDLAQGNLEARAPVTSRDEVGRLATVFNAMVPELRTHIITQESMGLARDVQQKLLPASAPQVPGFDIAGRSVYSEAVGGDYYDFMELTEDDGKRRIGIVVGDVSGHGVVAALTMMSVRALLRSHAGDGSALRPVMRAVNRHLTADSSGGRFVTLVYMVIDPATRDVRWISAGHGPILLYDPTNKTFEELAVHDIPLGVRSDWAFHENDRASWPSAGIIVIGTDGIWETENDEGRAFGKEGLMQVITQSAHLPAVDICAAVVARLKEFAHGTPQKDDVTLVVVKILPQQ